MTARRLSLLATLLWSLAIASPAPAAADVPVAAPPAEVAIVARLRAPLHDIELHSRALLAKGRKPPGIVPFLHAYAALRDRLDTQVSRRDYAGAVAGVRRDLDAVRAVAAKAGLHDFDAHLDRCRAALMEPPADGEPRPEAERSQP